MTTAVRAAGVDEAVSTCGGQVLASIQFPKPNSRRRRTIPAR
jgi:hypothetical protein